MATIVAIDFETADRGADSACAVGLAVVTDGVVTETAYRLIRPPRREFEFTYIHGITWSRVRNAPDFREVWQEVAPLVRRAGLLAAHNASFDRRVLDACCARAGIGTPATPFLCTVELARRVWNIRPTKLPDVCRHLRIPLDHHHAASDSLACAEIVAAALREGVDLRASRR